MKIIVFVILCFFSLDQIFAQDIIVKKDGTEIKSKIIEITPDFIKYKKFSQLDGPLRNVAIYEVSAVFYQDGTIEQFTNIDLNKERKSNPDDNQNPTGNQQVKVKNDIDTMTNEKVIKLTAEGNMSSAILFKIQESINCFDTTPNKLIDLYEKGVSIYVVLAIKNSKKNTFKYPVNGFVEKERIDTMTNNKIVVWTKIQIRPSYIINKMHQSVSRFCINVDSLIYLVDNKVNPEVINKLIEINNEKQKNGEVILKNLTDTLTNEKIIKLTKYGFQSNFLNLLMKNCNNVFEMNFKSIIYLVDNKVSIFTINYMYEYSFLKRAEIDYAKKLFSDTLSNDDILRLDVIGLHQNYILAIIKNSSNLFDCSDKAIKKLKSQKVNEEILNAMKDACQLKTNIKTEPEKQNTQESKKGKENKNNDRFETLTNEQIIEFTKTGFKPSAIISKIKNAICKFDLSIDALIILGDNGVDKEVINEMVRIGSK
jgi:hypothetical protein